MPKNVRASYYCDFEAPDYLAPEQDREAYEEGLFGAWDVSWGVLRYIDDQGVRQEILPKEDSEAWYEGKNLFEDMDYPDDAVCIDPEPAPRNLRDDEIYGFWKASRKNAGDGLIDKLRELEYFESHPGAEEYMEEIRKKTKKLPSMDAIRSSIEEAAKAAKDPTAAAVEVIQETKERCRICAAGFNFRTVRCNPVPEFSLNVISGNVYCHMRGHIREKHLNFFKPKVICGCPKSRKHFTYSAELFKHLQRGNHEVP